MMAGSNVVWRRGEVRSLVSLCDPTLSNCSEGGVEAQNTSFEVFPFPRVSGRAVRMLLDREGESGMEMGVK